MDRAKLSSNVKKALNNSRDEAIRLKNGSIGVEHLFLGIIREKESSAVQLLTTLGADIAEIRSRIESAIGQSGLDIQYTQDSEIPILRQTEKIIRLSYLESTKLKDTLIRTEHLILALLLEHENMAAQLLEKQNITYDSFSRLVRTQKGISDEPEMEGTLPDFSSQTSEDNNDDSPYPEPGETAPRSESKSSSKTPALENFGRDLTTPGSPMSTGLFFLRRERICAMRSNSFSLPTIGSRRPSSAAFVKSRPKFSKAGVLLLLFDSLRGAVSPGSG